MYYILACIGNNKHWLPIYFYAYCFNINTTDYTQTEDMGEIKSYIFSEHNNNNNIKYKIKK